MRDRITVDKILFLAATNVLAAYIEDLVKAISILEGLEQKDPQLEAIFKEQYSILGRVHYSLVQAVVPETTKESAATGGFDA